jgi:ATP-dependent DNA helicase RecG
MITACGESGIKGPDIRYDHAGLWVEFTYPETRVVTAQETTQEKILTLLRDTPSMTRKQLAGRIGRSEDGVKYHLTKLKKEGYIRHVGPTRAGRWEVLK